MDIYWIEGYSYALNLAFFKFETGNSYMDAYHRVKCAFCERHSSQIVIDEMKIVDCKPYIGNDGPQPSGFVWYPLTNDIIAEFREDEERYMMGCEDV